MEDALFRLVVAFEVVTANKALDGFLLFARECLWYVHTDIDHQVAASASVSLNSRQSLASQAHGLTRLCAVLNFNLQIIALDGGDIYLTSKCCCWEVEQEIVYQIVTVSDKKLVVFLFNIYLDVTGNASAMAGITLSWYVDYHAFGYTSGDIDFYYFLTLGHTSATTMRTLVLDNLTLTLTGRTYTSFRTGEKRKRPFNIIKIGLNRDRDELYERINQRVLDMVGQGLEQEARAMLPYRELNALNTVGYKEMFLYFDGAIPLEEAVRQIQSNSRRYARKQLTWYKRDAEIMWFNPENVNEITNYIDSRL